MQLPKLNHDIKIVPLDSNGTSKYVIEANGRHFAIDDKTKLLIECIGQSNSYFELQEKINLSLGQSQTIEELDNVINNVLPKIIFANNDSTNTAGQSEKDRDSVKNSPLTWQIELLTKKQLIWFLKCSAVLNNKTTMVILAAVFLVVQYFVHHDIHPEKALSGTNAIIAALIVILGVIVHEIGHLSVCHKYGASHGGIGFGLYWIFPTFYSDVTGAWVLSRKRRAHVDIGGVYLQSVYLILIGTWLLFATNKAIPYAVNTISLAMMAYTLNPVLKFDGYWLLSDLTGSTNLHEKISGIGKLIVSPKRINVTKFELTLFLSYAVLSIIFFLFLTKTLINSLAISLERMPNSVASGIWVVILALLICLLSHKLFRKISEFFISHKMS